MKLVIAAEVCSFELMKVVRQHLIDTAHDVLDLGMTWPSNRISSTRRPPVWPRRSKTARPSAESSCAGQAWACVWWPISSKASMPPSLNRSRRLDCTGSLTAPTFCAWAPWIVGPYVARDMVDAWLHGTIGEGFSEERRRVQAEGYARIQQIEAANFK